jgi:CubicO group peptidase (beta-lactamase class C family)
MKAVWIALLAAGTLAGAEWERATPEAAGLDAKFLDQARDYALTGQGSGVVIRGGKLVYSWGDLDQLYDLKSSTKSFGSTALAVALMDGKLRLDQKAGDCLPGFGTPPPQNRLTGWLGEITLFHLATQTAGFDKRGGYEALLFQPGEEWSYSDGGPNWLADCLTHVYKRDLQELMFERVFEPIGIERKDLRWRDNQYRTHEMEGVARREFGSGIHADVEAMARLGWLWCSGGAWEGERLLPADYVEKASRPLPELVKLPVRNAERYPEAAKHYGFLWWNNGDGTIKGVPRDAFWSWGLYDSLIVVIPSLDMVVARAGKSFAEEGWSGSGYAKLAPFFRPMVKATGSPYPRSPVIREMTWAPQETIVRKAKGGDNWPLTWTADGSLFAAYGDGWGFEPFIKPKLSLGFSKITGGPENFEGVNVRSDSGEQIGQGPKGKKASGMLMVDGVLYMAVRNAGNAQLAWSEDGGVTWTWSDWKFETSFGAPSFLNYGKNYAGARDEYVYLYSQDADSAYDGSDRLVLARVPKQRIRKKEAYEYFSGMEGNAARWSSDMGQRAGTLVNPGRVYRTSVSYDAGLKRYLACVILPEDDTRFAGGFSVFDAPEPWGPWTTVYYTEHWDVGPGETCHFPTKWMSADGKTVHMVFSGDDHFSVRKAALGVGGR